MREQYLNPFLPGNKAFMDAMRDYNIWLHLLEDGQELDSGLKTLFVMVATLDHYEPRKLLADALTIMNAAEERGTWETKDLKPLAEALRVVKEQYPLLPKQVAHSSLLKALT